MVSNERITCLWSSILPIIYNSNKECVLLWTTASNDHSTQVRLEESSRSLSKFWFQSIRERWTWGRSHLELCKNSTPPFTWNIHPDDTTLHISCHKNITDLIHLNLITYILLDSTQRLLTKIVGVGWKPGNEIPYDS